MGHIETLLQTGVKTATTRAGITWILGTLFLSFLFPLVVKKLQTSKFPVINPSPKWDLFDISSTIDYARRGRLSILEGVQKYAGKPFILNTDYKPKLILSPDYIDHINAEPALDFQAWLENELLAKLPEFKILLNEGDIAEKVVRMKLTQNLPKFTQPLSDETALALDEKWGKSSEWQTRVLKEDNLSIIARLSAMVFAGPELARNKDWQRITVDCTVNTFLGLLECRLFPKFLQPLAAKFMPHAVMGRRNYDLGIKLLKPVLEARRREKEEAAANGTQPPYYNDAIEWAEQLTANKPYDPLRLQMGLALAAIHTSTDLLTKAVYRLCQNPEFVEPLRKEAEAVIGQTGWTKTSLYELKLLDSLLKETQRLEPITTTFMNRFALAHATLPGGIEMKKGDICMISSHRMVDPAFYPEPQRFDPYRFAKRREDPQLQHKSHLVSTSPDFTGFSHGKHACPGRFFAANEIKIALVHMVLKYDFKLESATAAKSMELGTAFNASSAKVLLRRRQCAIDI